MNNNFFFSETAYEYTPIIKPYDPEVVEKDITAIRKKVVEVINEQIKQKDLSRSEVSMATRMSSSAIGPIIRGSIDKVSTDRLLRMARRLGLKPHLKFTADN